MLTQTDQVPHLTTALTGPLRELEHVFLNNQIRIESWLRQQWELTPPPFYSSVDLRNAGFKLAPVDTNLFPAGFNNLNPDFLPLAIQAAQSTLSSAYPKCQRILLIPENHTRNTFYFENLATLKTILTDAGYEVRLGSLIEDLATAQTFSLPSGRSITLEPLQRSGTSIGVEHFAPCIVILNNDLSSGTPDILSGITQPVLSPLELGWAHRSKANHFKHYQKIAEAFAELIQIDPWLINPLFNRCDNVDFNAREGESCLVELTDQLLRDIQKKYDALNIQEKPYVVIKADTGTYGLGVLVIEDASQLTQLNRKQRAEMSKTKGNQKIRSVILQEGVFTFERVGNPSAVAEPVVYMLGRYVIGGFYRVHTQRRTNENLNAPGMHFEPLAFASSCNLPRVSEDCECAANRFYAYGVVARLAALAAAREIQEVKTLGYPQHIGRKV